MRARVCLGLVLLALVGAVAAVGGAHGLEEALVGAGPLLAIGLLLAAARYPGERALARLIVRRPGATLRGRLRIARSPVGTRMRSLALERAVLTRRGPPAAAPLAG